MSPITRSLPPSLPPPSLLPPFLPLPLCLSLSPPVVTSLEPLITESTTPPPPRILPPHASPVQAGPSPHHESRGRPDPSHGGAARRARRPHFPGHPAAAARPAHAGGAAPTVPARHLNRPPLMSAGIRVRMDTSPTAAAAAAAATDSTGDHGRKTPPMTCASGLGYLTRIFVSDSDI
jgi:hypothetical protein